MITSLKKNMSQHFLEKRKLEERTLQICPTNRFSSFDIFLLIGRLQNLSFYGVHSKKANRILI